jgi:hypothetical protein
MTTGTTGQLGLALPVQGELSGTWGNTVNNGITEYTNIAIAGTLSFAGDGAINLVNTTGDASATNIGSTTAQYMAIRVTGTTTTKVITGPSYSKTYVVDNASSFPITFKAAGQTGVSIVAGEKAIVFYNSAVSNADYVKVSSTVSTGVTSFSAGTTGLTPSTATTGAVTLAGILTVANGGTGTATPSLVAGTNVTITGTWPNQTVASTGGGSGVSSVTASSPLASSGGATPNISFTGTLPVANGGTGQTSYTNGQLLIGNTTGNTLTKATLTAGSGISVTNGTGSITIAATGASAATPTALGTVYGSTPSSGNMAALGINAGANQTTGELNVAVGYNALVTNTTAGYNTAVGAGALSSLNTTGSTYNTAVGATAGNNISTGTYNAIFSTSGSPVFNVTTESNRLVMGHTSVTNAYVQVAWTVVSDARDKTNFAAIPHGLDFVKQLQPCAYQFKKSRDDDTPHGNKRYGFKAQDILALEGNDAVIIDVEDTDRLKYNGEALVPVLTKAIQELCAQVETLKAEFAAYVASHP